ncbi:hypothetical protein HY00_03915, partial [Peptococcaceae bacterium SCADC1_2_3]
KSTRKKVSVITVTLFTLSLLATLMLAVPIAGANLSSISQTEENINISGDLNIDPNIQGEEREVIEKIMRTLDPEDRENVIYISDSGKVYANKPELKSGVEPLKHVRDNVYQDSKGNQYAFPDETIKGGTGPFRRVMSKEGTTQNTYAWTSAYVHIGKHPNDVYEKSGTNDTAYVYTGGKGSTGVEVDAGLQHSPTYDNWAWVTKVGTNPPYSPPEFTRFKSDQDVFLKFYVNQNNQVTLSVTGYDVNNIKKTWTKVRDASGWMKNGIGNAIKRNTTIAQAPENLLSGFYHKNVRWYNCKIGLDSTNNHNWSGSDVNTSETTKYPNDSRVTVNWVSWAEETDHINLN